MANGPISTTEIHFENFNFALGQCILCAVEHGWERGGENREVAKHRSCIILQVFPKISKGHFIFSEF